MCGFTGRVSEELCVRWHQIGSFLYTFYRNHNFKYSPEQNPTVFSEYSQKLIRKSILNRYSLAPYYYTLLYRAHQFGEMVIKPMGFYKNTNQEYESQFMISNDLIICPILEENQNQLDCFLPAGIWCRYSSDFTDLSPIQNDWKYGKCFYNEIDSNFTFSEKELNDDLIVFIRIVLFLD